MPVISSAPGKLVLCGEYAVLEGAPALVLAVGARARVVIEDAADNQFRVAAPDVGAPDARFAFDRGGVQWIDLDETQRKQLALIARVIETFGIDQPPFHARLDTHAFSFEGEKLGLGSSAALTVALAGALNARARRETPRVEEMIALHRTWQGGRGSGLDIAASYHGGLSIYRLRDGEPFVESVQWPCSLHWCCVWSGRAASTGAQLRKLAEWRACKPEAYSAAMLGLWQRAEAVADAVRVNDAEGVSRGIADYAKRLREFDDSAGLDIFAGGHREIAALADAYGVVYKPCGAGGGDIGIALSCDANRIEEFRNAFARTPFNEIELKTDEHGLRVSRGDRHSAERPHQHMEADAVIAY